MGFGVIINPCQNKLGKRICGNGELAHLAGFGCSNYKPKHKIKKAHRHFYVFVKDAFGKLFKPEKNDVAVSLGVLYCRCKRRKP